MGGGKVETKQITREERDYGDGQSVRKTQLVTAGVNGGEEEGQADGTERLSAVS